jgi:NADPH:quinone reductase-like Zn-dependent oxidoreductase
MTEATMKAIRVHRYGGAEELQFETAPCPEPRAGEVLIRVAAVGVLPIEWKVRQGVFQNQMPVQFPYIPGSALAGVVEAVGPGGVGLRVGQSVFGKSVSGAYAQLATAAEIHLALQPEGLRFEETATVSGGATTAWNALFENGNLQTGQRVLIHGAAGGVGSYAVQLAHWKGAQVIGTASARNVDFVRSLGADQVIDYTAVPFEQATQGMDLVLDTIGGETLRRSMAVVRPGGLIVSLVEAPSPEQAQTAGIRAMMTSVRQPYPSANLLDTIGRLLAGGEIRAVIGAAYPLHKARQAHEAVQSGSGRGRVILRAAPE